MRRFSCRQLRQNMFRIVCVLQSLHELQPRAVSAVVFVGAVSGCGNNAPIPEQSVAGARDEWNISQPADGDGEFGRQHREPVKWACGLIAPEPVLISEAGHLVRVQLDSLRDLPVHLLARARKTYDYLQDRK